MTDIGIFIFGMFVFAVAICSSLITVLAGNATPAEQTKPPERKKDVRSSGTVVAARNR